MDIKKLPHNIIVSFKKFLRGEEDFWITLLGWGMGFYFISINTVRYVAYFYIFCLKFFMPLVNDNIFGVFKTILFVIISIIVQICGFYVLILYFIYPLIFIFSLIRSSLRNTFVYVVFAYVVVIIFVPFHLFLGMHPFITILLIFGLNAQLIWLIQIIKSFILTIN